MRNKREKFEELATKRVTRAIYTIRLIGNLSNRAAYEYGEEDARKILRALQNELDALKTKFAGGGARDFTFKL